MNTCLATRRIGRPGGVDLSAPISFTIDGRCFTGLKGDTLASALLANGVKIIARSFKYHRPRGIYGAGLEEHSSLVSVAQGQQFVPNRLATMVPLEDGIAVRSQNCWPSPQRDFLAGLSSLSRLLPPGFYYKTFMKPAFAWPWYEHFIRTLAGHGVAPENHASTFGQRRSCTCDLLVIGAGPAGLAAAREAGMAGLRVMLVERDHVLGASLFGNRCTIDGLSAEEWVRSVVEELESRENVRILVNSSVFASFGPDSFAVLEELGSASNQTKRWMIKAQSAVIAAGAVEQPLIFSNNDLPGIMLASAASAYLHRYGVIAGTDIIVATNNDSGYALSLDLARAGSTVSAVVDSRRSRGPLVDAVKDRGIPVHLSSRIHSASGKGAISSVDITGDAQLGTHRRSCDLLCVSGGWAPAIELFAQSCGPAYFDEECGGLLPTEKDLRTRLAGACAGVWGVGKCIRSGIHAARELISENFSLPVSAADIFVSGEVSANLNQCKRPIQPPRDYRWRSKAFVDFQNDVTVADIEIAVREGYFAVEHLKRYTTLGMGTDQGRTSRINGIKLLSEFTKADPADVGYTSFRSPTSPIPLKALAAFETDDLAAPAREIPLTEWHDKFGAVYVDAGFWRRPQVYPAASESLEDAIQREARAARTVGSAFDISTLGKFELFGRNARVLLSLLTSTNLDRLEPGHVRYLLFLREDGIAFDDGTVTMIRPDHLFLTTTTGNAAAFARHIQYFAQVVWPQLGVEVVETTEKWCGIYLCGPAAIAFSRQFGGLKLGQHKEVEFSGMRALCCGTSLSGEFGFELFSHADRAANLWDAVFYRGLDFPARPAGLAALDILRIERGHFGNGSEIDGRASPFDLGHHISFSAKADFVGRAALMREAFADSDRLQLVGLRAEAPISAASQILDEKGSHVGHVASAAVSPTCGFIALAFVAAGRRRFGDRVYARSAIEMSESVAHVVPRRHWNEPTE